MALRAGFPLSRARCEEILRRLGSLRIAVLGDVHLDVYWHADMRRARLSRETPHFARPVVAERYDPGVGGVIAGNLRALGVGAVLAVGACGDDWRGDVLRRRLREMGVLQETFRAVPGRITPTYIKPMIRGYESVQEDPRIDFQDDRDLPPAAEAALLDDLRRLLPELDAIVVIDQIEDPTGGIVTAGVRAALSALARSRPELPILADSRARIGLFRDVAVKVNRLELWRAVGREPPEAALGDRELQDRELQDRELQDRELQDRELQDREPQGRTPQDRKDPVDPEDPEGLLDLAAELGARTGRAVIVSRGADGMSHVSPVSHVSPGGRGHVPALPVTGPIDPVGAGDSASAGLASALAAGATLPEAIALANLVAGVTVRKIGVTGTASPAEVLAAFEAFGASREG